MTNDERTAGSKKGGAATAAKVAANPAAATKAAEAGARGAAKFRARFKTEEEYKAYMRELAKRGGAKVRDAMRAQAERSAAPSDGTDGATGGGNADT